MNIAETHSRSSTNFTSEGSMKFKKIDERYLTERRRISEKYGPREIWSVIDHWPLYCGIGNLARYMAIAEIVRRSLVVPGHVAEFGSWRGANLLFIAKLLRILDPQGSKVVHCFESFEGLTEFRRQDAESTQLKGHYKGSLEELIDMIKLYEMEDEIVIHRGLIEETLPRTLEEQKALTFSLVYFDADLYEATKVALRHVHPRLAKGGLLVFDEWNYEDFPGEGIAVNEFLAEFSDCYRVEHVAQTRQPSLLLQKTI
jgi:Macrocin-O-methyltransferase (TylF)